MAKIKRFGNNIVIKNRQIFAKIQQKHFNSNKNDKKYHLHCENFLL